MTILLEHTHHLTRSIFHKHFLLAILAICLIFLIIYYAQNWYVGIIGKEPTVYHLVLTFHDLLNFHSEVIFKITILWIRYSQGICIATNVVS